MTASLRVVALIPARGGSKRIPGKNTRILAGHPLLAYAIATAREPDIFDDIVVSSDDRATLEIARGYGAWPWETPLTVAHKDDDPDIRWVEHVLAGEAEKSDIAVILRPTSPFRRGSWVADALQHFLSHQPADSLRAVRPVREHPGKMWTIAPDGFVKSHMADPYPQAYDVPPSHSRPTQVLTPMFVQTAALEIFWTGCVRRGASISGSRVLGWHTSADQPESLDINTEADWAAAVSLARDYPDALPNADRYGGPRLGLKPANWSDSTFGTVRDITSY